MKKERMHSQSRRADKQHTGWLFFFEEGRGRSGVRPWAPWGFLKRGDSGPWEGHAKAGKTEARQGSTAYLCGLQQITGPYQSKGMGSTHHVTKNGESILKA